MSAVVAQGRPRVLVVEDDPVVSDVVREVLESEGYSVVAAPHGAAALETVKRFQPAVILLDLHMPVMDGSSFVERYRRQARPPAAVLLFSGASDIDERAARLGADGFVRKPFHPDAFLREISACLAAT